jgi:hypothetical protein
MALAVAAKGGIGNVHADGFEADYGVAGGGVMASVSVGPMRFLGAVGGGYQIPINKSLRAGGIIQWVFQPSVAVSGPHNIGASVSGSIPISEGRWVHLVDVLGGYIHGGRGLKTAILLGAPITHREERMDFAIVSKVAWEF